MKCHECPTKVEHPENGNLCDKCYSKITGKRGRKQAS